MRRCARSTSTSANEATAAARTVRSVTDLDVVGDVSQGNVTSWAGMGMPAVSPGAPRVLLIDTGYKHTIARCLAERGVQVLVAPHDVTLATVRVPSNIPPGVPLMATV